MIGATGFTGKLVAEYLAREYGVKNENFVWADTGRSNQTYKEKEAIQINQEFPEILRPNTIEDYFNHPENFHKPREIQLGLELKW